MKALAEVDSTFANELKSLPIEEIEKVVDEQKETIRKEWSEYFGTLKMYLESPIDILVFEETLHVLTLRSGLEAMKNFTTDSKRDELKELDKDLRAFLRKNRKTFKECIDYPCAEHYSHIPEYWWWRESMR